MAANGRDALRALEKPRRPPFDLVVMDIQMPVMDGLEAMAAIRERERATGAHLPIVALTAHVMKGDRERLLQAGMDGYAYKPIRANELFAVIRAAVAGASASNEREVETLPAVFDRHGSRVYFRPFDRRQRGLGPGAGSSRFVGRRDSDCRHVRKILHAVLE